MNPRDVLLSASQGRRLPRKIKKLFSANQNPEGWRRLTGPYMRLLRRLHRFQHRGRGILPVVYLGTFDINDIGEETE